MLIRTHLAMTALLVLIFLPYVSAKGWFVAIALVATLIPDIDTAFSTVGKTKLFRIIQFFVKHRGAIHSLTIAVVISAILAYLWPVVALPFFLGYSFHIFLDSFTVEGVMPFWPYRKRSSWKIRVGSRIETSFFILLLVVDLLVFLVVLRTL